MLGADPLYRAWRESGAKRTPASPQLTRLTWVLILLVVAGVLIGIATKGNISICIVLPVVVVVALVVVWYIGWQYKSSPGSSRRRPPGRL